MRDTVSVLSRLINTPKSQAVYEEARHTAKLSLLLQEIREQAGMTRLEIARRMGVTPLVICRLGKMRQNRVFMDTWVSPQSYPLNEGCRTA
ncbi:MAG: helix-turn-helix transcriptional regulator [Candidatus Symbiodolus clandestinus]